jgi:hypothetical protein
MTLGLMRGLVRVRVPNRRFAVDVGDTEDRAAAGQHSSSPNPTGATRLARAVSLKSPDRLARMGEDNISGESNQSKPARLLAALLPVVGLVAVVVGCLVAWSNANAAFWCAYAPLSNQPLTGNGVTFVSQGTQMGLAVAVAGLLVLAFWVGHRIGSGDSRRDH